MLTRVNNFLSNRRRESAFYIQYTIVWESRY